jgi:hypothetical protein
LLNSNSFDPFVAFTATIPTLSLLFMAMVFNPFCCFYGNNSNTFVAFTATIPTLLLLFTAIDSNTFVAFLWQHISFCTIAKPSGTVSACQYKRKGFCLCNGLWLAV